MGRPNTLGTARIQAETHVPKKRHMRELAGSETTPLEIEHRLVRHVAHGRPTNRTRSACDANGARLADLVAGDIVMDDIPLDQLAASRISEVHKDVRATVALRDETVTLLKLERFDDAGEGDGWRGASRIV